MGCISSVEGRYFDNKTGGSITSYSPLKKSDLQAVVSTVFQKVLEPLYGSQRGALDKIFQGQDRKTRVFHYKGNPCGILVYKRDPSDEFAAFGVRESLEIKTLFLIDPAQNGGKGIAGKMLESAESFARRNNIASLHVTVSENKPESLLFFTKKKFVEKANFSDRYIPGVTEKLLAKTLIED